MKKSKRWAAVALLFWFASAEGTFAQTCCGTVCRCPNATGETDSHRHGRWFVVETENFQVCCLESSSRAEHMARHAEAVRARLKSKWLGESLKAAWNPRCQIVLHGTRQSYVNAVGRGSESTLGSSLVTVNDGRTLSRRIDLLGSGSDFLSAALPHELTHVILQEHFTATTMPRWADEGAAILADSQRKQSEHQKDLVDALARGAAFRAGELLTQDQYPGPDRMGTFYGQSASLTKFLIERATHEGFVDFIELATAKGYDTALRECYGIDGVTDLDRQWRRHMNPISTVAIAVN